MTRLSTTDQLKLVFKTFKTLLTFKADKDELKTKIDRSEISNEIALKIVSETGLVSPVAADDGSIYTDEKGAVYTL